ASTTWRTWTASPRRKSTISRALSRAVPTARTSFRWRTTTSSPGRISGAASTAPTAKMLPFGRKSSISSQYRSAWERIAPPAIVSDHRDRDKTPSSRHRNIVRAGGIEPLELARNEAERRCDDDLVDGGRIRTRQDRIAKSAVATARRIRLAGGAWEQQEHRSRRRLGIPFPNPPTKSDDLRSGERLRGVREHLAPGHGRIRF